MHVYINYPNPHFTIHKNPSCSDIKKNKKSDQRIVKVSPANLNAVLSQFINDTYKFQANPQGNDLWLEINLSTPEQEIGFVHVIQAILGERYTPLSDASIKFHCN